jgi:hypothetical protein
MGRWNSLWLVALAAAVGCSRSSYDATVEGTVTVGDQLASRGQVVFHPVKDGPTAYGNIFPNGSYSLRVGQGDLGDLDGGEVRSGDYIVTIVVNMPSVNDETTGIGGPPRPGPRLSAAKYAKETTSDLRVTVSPGRNVVPLDLEPAKIEQSDSDQGDAVSPDDVMSAADESEESEVPISTATEPASPSDAPGEESAP